MRILSANSRASSLAEEEAMRFYETAGYEILSPKSTVLPEPLRHFTPDFVAEKNGERVLVEVTGVMHEPKLNKLAELKEQIDKLPGWRLDVYLPTQQSRAVETSAYSNEQVEVRLRESKSLLSEARSELALVSAWIALEAVLRNLGLEATSMNRPPDSLTMLAHLYEQGKLSPTQYETLKQARALRNRIVHGLPSMDVPLHLVTETQDTVHQLLDQ